LIQPERIRQLNSRRRRRVSRHGQAWLQRKVFDKVRYMNAAGLRRKFDMQGYIDRVNRMRRELNPG
jgi:hypothetical protein